MNIDEWRHSLYLSFGAKADIDARVELLKDCTINGPCWVSSRRIRVIGEKRVGVRKAAFAMLCGPVPQGADVETTCGCPTCCMPGHLVVKRVSKH